MPYPPSRPGAHARLLGVLLAAAACGASAGPLAVNPPPQVEAGPAQGAAYRAGLAALVAGKLDEAQRSFEAAVKAEPRSAAPLLGLAEVAFQRKRPYDALARVQQALAVAPNDAAAHASMGRYLVMTGKPREAEASLRKAVELDALAMRPRMDLADLLASQRRWPEAVPLYEAVIAAEAKHAGAHYALGLAYAQTGRLDDARTALQKSAALDPRAPLPHVALARWHGGRKEYPQALAAVGAALERNPKLSDALLLRGDLLDASGDAAGALGAYEQAAKALPQMPGPLLRIAMLHHRTGDTAKALPMYIKAADLDPKNALVLNNIADIYGHRKDQLAEAERWANKAVAAAPKAAEVHDTLGWILRAKGNLPGARAALEKAAQIDPNNGETLYRLAQVYADQGDKARARQAIDAAMKARTPVVSAEPARKLLADVGG